MKKFVLGLAATTLVVSSLIGTAQAQTQQAGAANLHAQFQNATPFKQAACRGFGPYCGPGWTRACNRWRCWCRPCW